MIEIKMRDWQQETYNLYKNARLIARHDLKRQCGKTWLLVHIAMIEIANGKHVYIKCINETMKKCFCEELVKKLRNYNIPWTNGQIITRLPKGVREYINVFIYDEVDSNSKDLSFTTNINSKTISLRTGRE